VTTFKRPEARVGQTSAQWLEVTNPYDGALVGRVARFTVAEVEHAIATLGQHQADWTAHDRSRLLSVAAERLELDREGFVLSISRESGLARKDAEREVTRAVGTLRMAAAEALTRHGEAMCVDITAARRGDIAVALREPIGIVCAITPFNRPLNQIVAKLAPALAVGNRVVLKPSEQTPLTALRFVEMLRGCGLPPSTIKVVTGRPQEIGPALVTSPGIDMVTFTGSVAVGRAIAQRIGMIRSVFELGDSGALVAMPGSDLATVASIAAEGAFASAGQSCRGVKRIIAHHTIADDLAHLIAEHARRLRIGDPLDPDTDIGTLIHEDAARRVEDRVASAVEGGATIVFSSERCGAQLGPIVLDCVPRDCPLVQEETFGPCAPIIRVQDLDDAIDCVNDTQFGLQCGVFTPNWADAWRGATRLRVGAVVINGGPQFDSPNIPFGGVKASGLGREGVRFAMDEMSVIKTLVLTGSGGTP
jgi:acyl-CoA reductase-like NAD-dependent aldehyde dehydrogenase